MIKSWHLHKSDHKFDITINGVNANGIDAEIQMKSPPPCGDITPMEVVSNSRAEPQS